MQTRNVVLRRYVAETRNEGPRQLRLVVLTPSALQAAPKRTARQEAEEIHDQWYLQRLCPLVGLLPLRQTYSSWD